MPITCKLTVLKIILLFLQRVITMLKHPHLFRNNKLQGHPAQLGYASDIQYMYFYMPDERCTYANVVQRYRRTLGVWTPSAL